MPRPPTPPTFAGMPVSQLAQYVPDNTTQLDHPPKYWFEHALYYADKATMAEKKSVKQDKYVNYVKACGCYVNAVTHPEWPDAKKQDSLLASRVRDFKPTHEHYLAQSKKLKQELKQEEEAKPHLQPRPATSRKQSGPETASIGNLRDRMNALAGHGMAVETIQSKRSSREIPVKAAKPAPLRSASTKTRSSSDARGSPTIMPNGNQIIVTGSSSIQEQPPAPSVHGQPTGSSTRPRRSTNEGQGLSASIGSIGHPISPTYSPAPLSEPRNAGPSRSPVPIINSPQPPTPQSQVQTQPQAQVPTHRPLPIPKPLQSQSSPVSPSSPPNQQESLLNFEKSFPSLSEFGKQWEEEPPNPYSPTSSTPASNGDGKYTPKYSTITEEEVPGLPKMPSVPINRPGLPPPPSRPDILSFSPAPDGSLPNGADRMSPLKPDETLHRPASFSNVARLDSNDQPAGDGKTANGNAGSMHFPVATPTPSRDTQSPLLPRPQSAQPVQKIAPKQIEKPKFPFSNSVSPLQIREYFLNPVVSMLFLDLRPEEHWKTGYVGKEYEARIRKSVDIVGIDPTILSRPELTTAKLEDALSLSPPEHLKAFANRHAYDLVVVYDSNSPNWPSPPFTSGAPPLAKLWDMFFMGPDEKRLQRSPVLLIGGYEGWRQFIKQRSERAKTDVRANGQNGHVPKHDGPSVASVDNKKANREAPVYQSAQYSKTIAENLTSAPQSMTGESHSPHGQAQSKPYPPSPATAYKHSRSGSTYSSHGAIAAPPQASIHPGQGARRRSDYIEHNGQPYSGATSSGPSSSITSPTQGPAPGAGAQYYTSPSLPSSASGLASSRIGIDYPQAHPLAKVPMPPPAVARPMERFDYLSSQMGSGKMNHGSGGSGGVVRSNGVRGLDSTANGYGHVHGHGHGGEDRAGYWQDVVLGITGLKNLGNTCYMNSTIQCLSATYPFSTFFLDGTFANSVNKQNPLGTKGELAKAWAELLGVLWREKYDFLSPMTFRKQITRFAPQFLGTDQHDSQEFLSFVLDGLHEDLNRVKHKPPPVEMTPEREAMLEISPPEQASESEWNIYRQRNDSLIVDLFQGQYRNRLECLTCHKTSTTYDAFMYMSLPVPAGKSKVVVQELIDEFVKSELMEKDNAWNCPRCKKLRRASKTLTIARLPPVLLIQLKRFSTRDGIHWDKSETPVIFPVKGLDLSRYVPSRQRRDGEDIDDPRTQVGPFKYDLYGVSNHMGTLSSGHYTAFVKSKEGWKYCEDSKISQANERDVVSRPAYILFYKRVPA